MAWWMLECPGCKKEFPHSEVSSHFSAFDPFTGTAAKPDFPKEGLRVPCPHCARPSIYQRHQLLYRVVAESDRAVGR